ncbi:tyrosine-type recombinase/integrase [Azospirillum halopraeferens]|uniref:tyrosine-type recombinase/integrase n=1 Tax=Azospirillum halopraeferens TaxID=34010 RepID=UPI000406E434|nr:tyrosine-type recombinase/integrase [Azospirillum halopraeferens]
MSALLDGFLRHLTGKVHPETIVDYRQSVGLFIELAGDWPVDSVRPDRVLAFRDGVRRLPAKYGQFREFKGKPLRDAIALADSIDESAEQRVDARIARGEIPQANRMHAIREALVPRLSMKAANKHLTALRAFFQYAREAGHTTGDNPVTRAFYAKSLIGKKARDERAAWEPEAVRAVLLSPAWTGCRSLAERAKPGPLLVQDDFYWTWLVLTHHPLRLKEACQLMVRDVVLVHGIWCLRIAEDESAVQQLKTDNAERLVPVHRLLPEAGFLQHVERLRREGVLALFPTFQPTQASRSKQLTESVAIGVRQRFGRKFYKKISAYLRALDQHEDGRVNHSLRHTIDTMLHNEDVASVRIAELLGHQRMSGGETTSRYEPLLQGRHTCQAEGGDRHHRLRGHRRRRRPPGRPRRDRGQRHGDPLRAAALIAHLPTCNWIASLDTVVGRGTLRTYSSRQTNSRTVTGQTMWSIAS